jgi:putative ABC transport system permease protein
MRFSRLILTNLIRHRLRGLFGVAGISFGVAAMLTVLSVVMGAISMFQNILESDNHYLVFERNVSDLFFSSVPAGAVARIEAMENVAGAYPVLFGIVSSEGHPVVTCFGVEAANPRLGKARWTAGDRTSFGQEPDTVCLGSRAAEFLHAGFGDVVQIGKKVFTVMGIIETENGFEDGGVFLPLDAAQAFFRREGIASIVAINLVDPSVGEVFREQVESLFPDLSALPSEEFSDSYSQFKILNATAWAVGLSAFLLGGMSVANTMTMSVFTRIREIAILRVCGFSRWQTSFLIIGEACLIATLGSACGLAVGFALLSILGEVPALHGYVSVAISPLVVAAIVATAFVTSILGSIYPAWHAARIQPAGALRYE